MTNFYASLLRQTDCVNDTTNKRRPDKSIVVHKNVRKKESSHLKTSLSGPMQQKGFQIQLQEFQDKAPKFNIWGQARSKYTRINKIECQWFHSHLSIKGANAARQATDRKIRVAKLLRIATASARRTDSIHHLLIWFQLNVNQSNWIISLCSVISCSR